MTAARTVTRPDPSAGHRIGVMIVDDSAVVRGLVTRMIATEPSLTVVASVGDGARAVAELKRRTDVDIVVLDIEMPVMDGLTALPQLLAVRPGLPVLMASTLTQRNAEISLQAIRAGAIDYVPKPSTRALVGAEEFQRELIGKLTAIGGRRRRKAMPPPSTATAAGESCAATVARSATTGRSDASRAAPSIILRPVPANHRPEILCVGSSTGGPQALSRLFKDLRPEAVPFPVLVTQHMPPTFTTIFAEHLARSSGWQCSEAREGDRPTVGHIHVAPGDFHMEVDRRADGPVLHLTQAPAENFCRPSVDPMLRSVARTYGGRVLVAILTGMGSDGCHGAEAVVKAGGTVVAQDEETSVVWGMPGAVATAGLCSAVLPLDSMARTLSQLMGKPR